MPERCCHRGSARHALQVLTKIMGLLLTAIAIQMLFNRTQHWFFPVLKAWTTGLTG